MIGEKLKKIFKKGLPGALLEIFLIFIGITLAIAFDNWNGERKDRQDELALLADLKLNLEENLVIFDRVIDFNERTIASMQLILEYVETRRPDSDDLIDHLGIIDNWSSAWLTSSAYETLRSRGLEIISESSLRNQIVRLFEVEYTYLREDYDRAEWINYEVYSVPMMVKHFEEISAYQAKVVDYDALLADQQFRNSIRRTLERRKDGVTSLKDAAEATAQVITAIQKVTGP